jgi:hypothetical protein
MLEKDEVTMHVGNGVKVAVIAIGMLPISTFGIYIRT